MSRTLLTLACLVACAATALSSCVERIEGSNGGRQGLSGGWSGPANLNDAGLIVKVEAVAQAASEQYNQESDDYRLYEPMALGNGGAIVQKAFTQVVAGMNFCVRFTMQSTQCKSGIDAVCTDKSLSCDSQVYAPLGWTPAGNGPAAIVTGPVVCSPL